MPCFPQIHHTSIIHNSSNYMVSQVSLCPSVNLVSALCLKVHEFMVSTRAGTGNTEMSLKYLIVSDSKEMVRQIEHIYTQHTPHD